ncbi:hypothetical protein [Streptomyces asiaticus]|uniref:hypothetical protein n=1 Tax=Streptomyces asiaticus TaxID=114695 RepID=UPI00380FDAE2
MDLQSEGFEHPAAHGVGESRDLAPSGWQCVDEREVLLDGCLLPVAGDLRFLGLDLIIELGDPCLNPLDEPAVGVIGEFEGVELALTPLLRSIRALLRALSRSAFLRPSFASASGSAAASSSRRSGPKIRAAKNSCSGSKR